MKKKKKQKGEPTKFTSNYLHGLGFHREDWMASFLIAYWLFYICEFKKVTWVSID